MKSFWNLGYLAVAIAALGWLVLGYDGLRRETKAAAVRAHEAWTVNGSDEQITVKIRIGLDERQAELRKAEIQTKISEQKLAANQERLTRLKLQLAEEENVLSLARTTLNSTNEAIIAIKGRNYSRQDVERDANIRLEHCRDLARQVTDRQKEGELQEKTFGLEKSNLDKARQDVATYQQQFNAAVEQRENAKRLEGLLAIQRDFESNALKLTAAPDLDRLLQELVSRNSDWEMRVKAEASLSSAPASVVNYTGVEELGTQIDAYLAGRKRASSSVPAATK